MPLYAYNKNGFTLVELAIALMVIGLLIGGVLKGQELIENARTTRIAKDINDYDTAVAIFRSIYSNELPGDITNPASRLPNCNTAPCNNTVGTGSYSYRNGTDEVDTRRANFWRHLDRAGLISGINDAETNPRFISPVTAFDGHIFVNTISAAYYSDGGPTAAYPDMNRFFPRDVGTVNMMTSCRRIAALDTKLDDGKPLNGHVRLFIDRNYCIDPLDDNQYLNIQGNTDHLLVTIHSAQ